MLLRYGEKELTVDDVTGLIPEGLLSADSAAMFHSIIEGWIRDEVLAELAEDRLYDMEAIERRVNDYRNSLIVQEYLMRMRESHATEIDESKVRDYYTTHRKGIKLEVPLIKGIFLKINKDSRGKEEIKNLLTSGDPEKIDKLEQEWLDRSLEYTYFQDKWIDWETVSGLIPHRFGDPDEFLKKEHYFEGEYGDCAYYLEVTDYLPSGEEQPFEYARGWISEILTQGQLAEYENNLVESLVKKSIRDKRMEAVGYDPLRHEMIETR